ncbi:MAG: hypothetical protein ABSE93_23350 [Terriglobia bacterium]
MDGFEVCKRLRAKSSITSIRLVLIAAFPPVART